MSTSFWTSTTYCWLIRICLLLLVSFLLINASYTAIIGGTAIYFYNLMLLILTGIMIVKRTRYHAQMSLGCLAILLYILTMYGHFFLIGQKLLMLLPMLILCISTRGSALRPHWMPLMFIVSLCALAVLQQQQLKQLKAHYQSQDNGDSWQQYGAL